MRRFRRLRSSEAMRRMGLETRVAAEEMIYPIFIIEGENIKNPIASMPGVYQYSIDRMDEMLEEVKEAGIAGVLIFGIPAEKDEVGSQAYAPDGITQRAIRHIKEGNSPRSAGQCRRVPVRIYLPRPLRLGGRLSYSERRNPAPVGENERYLGPGRGGYHCAL